MARSLRPVALAALLAGVLAVAGCGSTITTFDASATNEGVYNDVGGLTYQVQISRQLNPADPEDKDYLVGLPAGVQAGADEVWFGVFMRVENEGDRPLRATTDYTITDTQNDTFRPVPLANTNVFAYRANTVQPGDFLPPADSAAASGPTGGGLLLFKLKTEDLQNRPLILHINQGGATGQSAMVELDL